ncbi:MAG TPA: peptide ABC transporter substrate-binding protein [Steroidobacteraceae bacterium]|nr:peptide ABC transporter substrate-binding protein [Steroidobacteraceae bacterium]
MHQAPEITHIAFSRSREVLKSVGILLLCSMFSLVITTIHGCTNKGKDDGGINLDQGIRDKSNSVRMLRRGLPGEPRTLDPQLADDTFSFPVLRDLYEGLTAEDRNGRIVPGVAESWTVDTTGTVYTFVLRPNAKWSDGAPIVAMDFVRGLRRAVDPRTASGSSALLTVIKGASDIIAGNKKVVALGVTATNENSVQIELEHPAPFVLQILSQPIAAPARVQTDAASAMAGSGEKPKISNGAYVLINRVPGSFIDLAKNPKYWDKSNVSIERVRYVNTESEATEIRKYVAGEIDMTSTIPAPDLDRVTQKYGAEIQASPILGTLYLGLNVSGPPLRDSRDLRQALSMTVDREMISTHIILGVTPAYSFVANGVRGYKPPAYAWSKWSRERQLTYAQTLYERAGYSKKRPLHLKLYFNTGESIQRIMIAIATNWEQNLGVDVDLVSDEFRVFLAGRKDRSRWDVIRLGWYADYDDPASFLDVFSRDNSQNDPGYMSSDFNNLIDAARREPNSDVRMSLLQSSEEVLLNDYPIIPVYFYTARRLVKPNLGGAEITPLHHTYSKHLYWKSRS